MCCTSIIDEMRIFVSVTRELVDIAFGRMVTSRMLLYNVAYMGGSSKGYDGIIVDDRVR